MDEARMVAIKESFELLGLDEQTYLLRLLEQKAMHTRLRERTEQLAHAHYGQSIYESIERDNTSYRYERMRCGKKGCRCARGELHGPYWYAYRSEKGKRKRTYIGKSLLLPRVITPADVVPDLSQYLLIMVHSEEALDQQLHLVVVRREAIYQPDITLCRQPTAKEERPATSADLCLHCQAQLEVWLLGLDDLLERELYADTTVDGAWRPAVLEARAGMSTCHLTLDERTSFCGRELTRRYMIIGKEHMCQRCRSAARAAGLLCETCGQPLRPNSIDPKAIVQKP